MEIPPLELATPVGVAAGQRTALDPSNAPDEAVLRNMAEQFESVFLYEMLKHTGVGQMTEGFNGGPGEAAFSDFLVREYATQISDTGRLGLADHVFAALVEKAGS